MQQMEAEIEKLVIRLADALTVRGWQLACAESCTGGWISKSCTDVAGSSAWFDRSFVAYSYKAKTDLLGVSEDRLLKYGAVSEEVARDMAGGALERSGVNASLAVTGIAGPGGGLPDKPVGTVWFAWAVAGEQVVAERCCFPGNREAVRGQTVIHALQGLLSML